MGDFENNSTNPAPDLAMSHGIVKDEDGEVNRFIIMIANLYPYGQDAT
jgi:hypothetical protein